MGLCANSVISFGAYKAINNLDFLMENYTAFPSDFSPPLVLISQVQRSGGTFLTQLFDGHPQMLVRHSELRFGSRLKHFWAALPSYVGPDETFNQLEDPLVEKLAQKGYVKASPAAVTAPDRFDFKLDVREHRQLFLDACEGLTVPLPRNLLDRFVWSYFQAWSDYGFPAEVKCWCAFSARLSMMPGEPERFFSDYPDGALITMVRDPVSWLASAKRHDPKVYGDRVEAAFLWQASTLAALQLQKSGRNVLVVIFEDLVARPREIMTALCCDLGIAFSEKLLTPTFNGMPIRADTSFAAPNPGILADALDRSSHVAPEDAAFMEAHCRGIYEHCREIAIGYEKKANY